MGRPSLLIVTQSNPEKGRRKEEGGQANVRSTDVVPQKVRAYGGREGVCVTMVSVCENKPHRCVRLSSVGGPTSAVRSVDGLCVGGRGGWGVFRW